MVIGLLSNNVLFVLLIMSQKGNLLPIFSKQMFVRQTLDLERGFEHEGKSTDHYEQHCWYGDCCTNALLT